MIKQSIQPVTGLDELRRLLGASQQDYLLKSELPSSRAYLYFTGTLNAVPVVWNACIETMSEYARTHTVADDPQQFIDISVENDVYYLHVGLNLSCIDKATVERSIIMIRNYKRLSVGRHEYGARSKTL